jgi:hypothetical protein
MDAAQWPRGAFSAISNLRFGPQMDADTRRCSTRIYDLSASICGSFFHIWHRWRIFHAIAQTVLLC